MSFKISDKVVCVDDSDQDIGIPGDCVKKGVIYVVRDFSSLGGLRLVGVFGGRWLNGEEVSFFPSRFRLLSEVKEENAMKKQKPQQVPDWLRGVNGRQSDDDLRRAIQWIIENVWKVNDDPDLP